jgi:prepilin-type processing-associated H-X9-DG protein/prepilin-type N-terminal cleavage/methylation domain-containing protein
MSNSHNKKNKAFTLVELIVVIAICTLLASMVSYGVIYAKENARSAKCKSNLRNLALATLAYTTENYDTFPWGKKNVNGYKYWCWDFVITNDGTVLPGAIWSYSVDKKILQCPSFLGGKSNTEEEPYTGYNYNCSFIGKVEGDSGKRKTPAKLSQLKKPEGTALFGDGEFSGGANKFMRSPKRSTKHDASSTSIREAGTQGYRHRGKTNVAFCDGHVEELSDVYNSQGSEGFVSTRSGFISPDNSLYSLE